MIRIVLTASLVIVLAGQIARAAPADAPASQPAPVLEEVAKMLPKTDTPQGASSLVKWAILLTVLSVAPAVLVMVTCFTRIIVVLGLLRQALGTHQLPPNQVMFGLALLMAVVVMTPTFRKVYRDAIDPHMRGRIDQAQAIKAGEEHVRNFMIDQIEGAGNGDDVQPFLDEKLAAREDLTWEQVPTISMIPAFVISELKVAFAMGFRIFLPFLIIDMLVASVLVSMGMLMVPPALVSLPFKLLLFVLADGWHLVVGTLMGSFG